MKPKNNTENTSDSKKFVPITVGVTRPDISRIDRFAELDKKSRAEICRDAIDLYLKHRELQIPTPRESIIEVRLRVLERSIRALIVKGIRINGQTLFFATLPFAYGTPKHRLSDAGLTKLMRQSEEYAAALLKPRYPRPADKDPDTNNPDADATTPVNPPE